MMRLLRAGLLRAWIAGLPAKDVTLRDLYEYPSHLLSALFCVRQIAKPGGFRRVSFRDHRAIN